LDGLGRVRKGLEGRLTCEELVGVTYRR